MSGIILLVVLAIWFVIVTKLTAFFSSKIAPKTPKKWLYPIIFILLFIAPVADEIIGVFQFRALCKTEAIATYEKEKVYGKIVYLESAKVVQSTETILPVYKQTWKYADATTNKILISYVDLYSEGGWLSHLMEFTSNRSVGSCSGDKGGYLFQKLNIKKQAKLYGE